MWNNSYSVNRKDARKAVRTVLQIIILSCILYVLVNVLFEIKKYTPVSEEARTYDKGFIALSYFGVSRSENGTLIDDDRLREHLEVLKASGYETITQQDIYDYYKYGKKLPEKALFLFFEDGRADSALFAQKIIEKLNYKATMLTYANKFAMKDPKFLKPEDITKLKKGTFWETGTNGYRLEFINVFDRYGKYLGVLTSNEFSMLAPYIDEAYDHYLMDFIKDRDGIPIENREQMTERISYDYKALRDIYRSEIGDVPDMYVLMHSNSPYFATNPLVGQVNEKWIRNLFKMNFNREGESLNKPNDSVYNLTRLQPQSYWYTNHLLMRIWDDTKNNMAFVSGDTKRKAKWDTIAGASEFRKNVIVLTTLPSGKGLMRLKDSGDFRDVQVGVNLDGNKVGSQSVYLKSDPQLNSYIKVEIKDNVLYVIEKDSDSTGKELFSCDLRQLDGLVPQSIEENRLEAEQEEYKAIVKYSDDLEAVKKATLGLRELTNKKAPTVQEGAEAYIPEMGIGEKGSRRVDITLKGNKITVLVDQKNAVSDLEVNAGGGGFLFLEAAFDDHGYSHRNIVDDVYDGVFTDLVVKEARDDGKGPVLYDNRLRPAEKTFAFIAGIYNDTVDWFIETF